MTLRLFHVVDPDAWESARVIGLHAPDSLAREGFVHLSFRQQLAGTLDVHFTGATRLVVLELDRARLADALVVEPSRGGALFPHLYRALELADVLREHVVVRDSRGRFDLSALDQ